MHAGAVGVGGVEALDPGLRGPQQVGLLGDDENAVHARHHLELDVALAHAALAGIEDLLELGDDRLRIAVLNRKNADRLPAHPVHVEAQRGVHSAAAFRAGALNQQDVASGIGPHRARPGGEAVEQFHQRGGGDVLQRNNGNAVAGFGMAGHRIGVAAADRIAQRYDAIAHGVPDQHDIAHAQDAFEHVDQIGFRHRLAG